jgi:L,D-transpeptidase catalytic domain
LQVDAQAVGVMKQANPENTLSVRRILIPALVGLVAAGCGSSHEGTDVKGVLAAKAEQCRSGAMLPLSSPRLAYAAVVKRQALAYRVPGRAVIARFGKVNVNNYPTVFGVVGTVVRPDCTPTWYRVQLPMKPNGLVGFVRARDVDVATVKTRIVVDVSDRKLTLYRGGKRELTATVAVGSPATPTPTGRYYVNQRLVPTHKDGPFGPGAIGTSAFSNVLTGWTQGGPVAIHGTNAPWSIGRAVSNGCIRLPNPTLRRVFREVYAGTPVIITA